MAAIDEFSVPAAVTNWLAGKGYGAYTSMNESIAGWWAWYTRTSSWYDVAEPDSYSGRTRRRKRYSVKPAKRVCVEWASLIFNKDVRFQADGPKANALITDWCERNRLVSLGQQCTQRAFALGTGAIALTFDVPQNMGEPVRITPKRYDARMVLPLSWDDSGVGECAFVTSAVVRGERVTQCAAHVLSRETGTYHVINAMFDKQGVRVSVPGVIEDFDTRQPLPTFCLISPAIDNTVADMSPMGMSVFEDALDAVKAVDSAFDVCVREGIVCAPKVFMDDSLFDVRRDTSGKVTKVQPCPPEDTVIRRVVGDGERLPIETFQPQVRAEQLVKLLDAAKADLGDLTGFGANCFTSDKPGGLKTATEVSADSSALMRNLAKHEEFIGSRLSVMLEAVLACMRSLNGEQVEPGAAVSVQWYDSIIEDTPAEKAEAQAEVAAGLMAKHEYRMRFFGEDEQTARVAVADIEGGMPDAPDMGGIGEEGF